MTPAMQATETTLVEELARGKAMTSVPVARRKLWHWIKERDCAGHEPYDLLNSTYLSGQWARRKPLNILIVQAGRRFAGRKSRKFFRVPPSKNPKAVGLLLTACCDLARCGEDWRHEASHLIAELIRLRSPNEEFFSWGYDWDFYSLRGPTLPAFSPNSIATYFCGSAFLDFVEVFRDQQAWTIGQSVGEFFVRRLNRSVDLRDEVCFSYTPTDRTVIYNSNALVGSYLARLGHLCHNLEYIGLASRCMNHLASAQQPDGSWTYGAKRSQQWVDHFHTGYNLCALLDYIRFTGDESYEKVISRGYEFYKDNFFDRNGAPKYFHNSLYPIDIHSCSQAILTFIAFSERDESALMRAEQTANWTIQNMQSPEGFFYFQCHRLWTNRTPYMRWGQAWMFHALSKLESAMRDSTGSTH